MKFTTYISKITKFLDDCECRMQRLELKEILTVFRYESKYERIINCAEMKSLARRIDAIVGAQ